MSDNDSFAIAETPWDNSEVDFDAEMIEDDHSVIEGVVDDDFLMSLDDNESLAGITMDDDVNEIDDSDDFLVNQDDIIKEAYHDVALNRNSLDDEHHFHTTRHNVSEDYSESDQIPTMFTQSGSSFQRQQSQRYHSLQSQIPVRQHSFNHEDFSRQQHLPHHRPSPSRGHSERFAPMRFSERIPDRILENTPSFYSEQYPIGQHRSFTAHVPFHGSVEDPPQSPIPNEIDLFESKSNNIAVIHNRRTISTNNSRSAPAFRVTPEPSNSSISLPDSFELQLQYQRTLKRLGNSMRRSDVTRALVNRQRSGCSQSPNGNNNNTDSERSMGAFYPKESSAADLEEARRRLYQLIHHEN